jgi:hypothetical protein
VCGDLEGKSIDECMLISSTPQAHNFYRSYETLSSISSTEGRSTSHISGLEGERVLAKTRTAGYLSSLDG